MSSSRKNGLETIAEAIQIHLLLHKVMCNFKYFRYSETS